MIKGPGFVGFATLEAAIRAAVVVTNSSWVPINADAAPTYRIYGPSGLMTSGTGSLTAKDTFTVTGATNASPIVITTSASHGLQTGQRVTISGVLGNLAANTTATITVVSSTTFSLDGVAGNGAYTSGGSGAVSGLYDWSFTPAASNGFSADVSYAIVFTAVVSGVTYTDVGSFICV